MSNSNKRLIAGLVRLLRDNISGWSTNSEHNVDNVWGKNVPESAEQEFPRGSVDVVAANDFELSVDLNTRLREATVRVVVFAKADGPAEELIEDVETAIQDHWDGTDSDGNPYVGDWSFREVDGTTPLNETEGEAGDLRYNRSEDFVFETVRS